MALKGNTMSNSERLSGEAYEELFGANGKQEIQRPPHADAVEQKIKSEISTLLTRQTAISAQYTEQVVQTQRKLGAQLQTTAHIVDQAMNEFTETLVEIREYNEQGAQLLKRLEEKHSHLNSVLSR